MTRTALIRPESALEGALTRRETPTGVADWGALGVRSAAGLAALLPAEVPFETSGSPGRPVTWWRTGEQLAAEAELLAARLAGAEPDAVFVHAPLGHLYGLLLGCLVPALLGVPAHYLRATDAPPSGPDSPVVAAVPSTWWQLERSAARLRARTRLTVVHSTARLPDDAVTRVGQALPGLRLLELHGSTETGLVATRSSAGADWTLAEDVRFTAPAALDGPELLAVTSPRVARAAFGPYLGEHLLDDEVLRTGPRSYRLTGLRRRLVKVNGRRVDLRAVEERLRAALPAVEVSSRTFADPVRGEWYDLLAVGGEPERRAVQNAAARLIPVGTGPRAVRVVPAVLPGAGAAPAAPGSAALPRATAAGHRVHDVQEGPIR
ncbi:AMP-binding protein [Kitasatospora indigofera]|uniref:AMP-binding protein n=1 Tax=Kitasatospora indigofera TaxID=67307 RepID=UPI003661B7FF